MYVLSIVMGSCLAKELYVDNGEKFHINNALITLNGSDRIGGCCWSTHKLTVPVPLHQPDHPHHHHQGPCFSPCSIVSGLRFCCIEHRIGALIKSWAETILYMGCRRGRTGPSSAASHTMRGGTGGNGVVGVVTFTLDYCWARREGNREQLVRSGQWIASCSALYCTVPSPSSWGVRTRPTTSLRVPINCECEFIQRIKQIFHLIHWEQLCPAEVAVEGILLGWGSLFVAQQSRSVRQQLTWGLTARPSS